MKQENPGILVVTSQLAQRLLPQVYGGKVDLNHLAQQIQAASEKGKSTMDRLKIKTDKHGLLQAFDIKDINKGMVESLEYVQQLSEAQIALQALTADINDQTLQHQLRIEEQSQSLAMMQGELNYANSKLLDLVQDDRTVSTETLTLLLERSEEIRVGVKDSDLLSVELSGRAKVVEDQLMNLSDVLVSMSRRVNIAIGLSMVSIILAGYAAFIHPL